MSVSRSAVWAAVHAAIDAVMDMGDAGDYYKLNHASTKDMLMLARIITVWLQLQKVEVTNSGQEKVWRKEKVLT